MDLIGSIYAAFIFFGYLKYQSHHSIILGTVFGLLATLGSILLGKSDQDIYLLFGIKAKVLIIHIFYFIQRYCCDSWHIKAFRYYKTHWFYPGGLYTIVK